MIRLETVADLTRRIVCEDDVPNQNSELREIVKFHFIQPRYAMRRKHCAGRN
jgi:hypothetical protein